MIGISAAPLVARPAPAGLVAAYGFNEGTGVVVGDASGNNHPAATLEGGVTWTTTAKGDDLDLLEIWSGVHPLV
jgi:hypothetical protein